MSSILQTFPSQIAKPWVTSISLYASLLLVLKCLGPPWDNPPPPANAGQLFQLLQQEWNAVLQQTLVRLAQSMRQRCLQRVAANGAHTRYWPSQNAATRCDVLKGGGGGGCLLNWYFITFNSLTIEHYEWNDCLKLNMKLNWILLQAVSWAFSSLFWRKDFVGGLKLFVTSIHSENSTLSLLWNLIKVANQNTQDLRFLER